jgi:hypothetical protein
MVKATPPVVLSALDGTTEELAAATKFLASLGKEAKRSKMASMTHFVKQNADEFAKTARGPVRELMLKKFMIHQMRSKEAEQKVISSHKISSVKSEVTKDHEWSSEQMDKELGSIRGETLRESKRLVSHSCPLTGSDEPHMRIWIVPQSYILKSENKIHAMNVEAKSDLNEEDYNALCKMEDVGAAPSSSADGAVNADGVPGFVAVAASTIDVKLEPTPENRIEKFNANNQTILKNFQEMELEMNQIKTAATGKSDKKDVAYCDAFLQDIDKHIKNLGKTTKQLFKLATTNSPVHIKFIEGLDKIKAEQDKLVKWAIRYEFREKGKKRRSGKSV